MLAVDSRPSAKVTLMVCGVLHHVQVGQDDALVDDDHAGAHAALAVFLAVLVFAQADDAHDRGNDGVVSPGAGGGQHRGLQGFEHGCVDVFLRQLAGTGCAAATQS
jgi:hypothetical protein